MTVCVASISQLIIKGKNLGPIVIGASDRMLTAGNVQFQPQQPKMQQITPAIIVMVAGDMATQAEIYHGMRRDVDERIAAEPARWVPVEYAARSYVRHYEEVKRRRAEHTILAPLGLTIESFVERQSSMQPGLVSDLARDLIDYPDLNIQALIVGLDESGAHIYTVDGDGDLRCEDAVAFAAIGIGAGHARSHMMATGHTRGRLLPEGIYQTYAAKRRAEVAPGVGRSTDMFAIGPTLGAITAIESNLIDDLGKMFDGIDQVVHSATSMALDKFNEASAKSLEAGLDQAGAAPQEQSTEPT